MVVVGYTVASGALAIGVVTVISGFGPPHPALAIAFLAAQALVLMTLTLALGSVLPAIGAGAIAVVAFGIGWMAGVMASVAAALGVQSLAGVAEVSRWLFPSDGLWRGVVYGLEPPARLAHRPRAESRGPVEPTRSSRCDTAAAGLRRVVGRCGSRSCSGSPAGGSSAARPLAGPGPRAEPRLSRDTGSSPARWSSTRPTLCMKA